ncbi:AAA family ATPase, partial [Flavobacteriaceae bacterium]|nr:AAA family ATPase [Flavobacteriaceae bacterium]
EHILSTKDNISAITGFAGTGKSYMLKITNIIARQETNNQHHFIGLAPSGIATNHLRDSAYIANSKTLQYFLTKYDGYANNRGTKEGKELTKTQFKNRTIIIDEASMISLKQMKDLFTISKELDLKVILMGDQKQLDAVEAGNPFKLITQNQKANNIKITNIEEIVRQENEQLKTAVQSIITQDIKQTINNLTKVIEVANDNNDKNQEDKQNNHTTIKNTKGSQEENQKTGNKEQPIDPNELLKEKAVETYMNQPITKRQNTLILTTNNKLKDQINEEISKAILQERRGQNLSNKNNNNNSNNHNIVQKIQQIKENISTKYQNLTTKQEQEKQTLKAQNITKAQASQSFNYQRNQTIIFNKEIQKLEIKKDDQYQIINIDNNKNILFLAKEQNATETKEFDLNKLQGDKDSKENNQTSNSNNAKLPFNLFNKLNAIFRSKDQIIFNKNLKTHQGQKIINSQIATIDKIKRNGDYVISLEQKQDKEIKQQPQKTQQNIDNKSKQQNQNTITFKSNDPNLKHISHYYACTTHKAQGLTKDHIIAVNNSQDRKELLTQKNFYVQISRAKKDVTLITDNVKKTEEKLNVNIGEKISGHEHQGVVESQIVK